VAAGLMDKQDFAASMIAEEQSSFGKSAHRNVETGVTYCQSDFRCHCHYHPLILTIDV
jgi:hypothetical protein